MVTSSGAYVAGVIAVLLFTTAFPKVPVSSLDFVCLSVQKGLVRTHWWFVENRSEGGGKPSPGSFSMRAPVHNPKESVRPRAQCMGL